MQKRPGNAGAKSVEDNFVSLSDDEIEHIKRGLIQILQTSCVYKRQQDVYLFQWMSVHIFDTEAYPH